MNGHQRRLTAVALVALMSVASGPLYAAADPDSFVESAKNLIAKNDLKGAEIQLRNAVHRAPQDGTLRMELARLYLRQGNIAASEAELIAAKQRGITSEDHAMLLA